MSVASCSGDGPHKNGLTEASHTEAADGRGRGHKATLERGNHPKNSGHRETAQQTANGVSVRYCVIIYGHNQNHIAMPAIAICLLFLFPRR